MFINPSKRQGRKLLLNPQAMHAAVRGAFPPDLNTSEGRVLWRIDSDRDVHTLYIVGPEVPDMTALNEHAGWHTRPAQTADYQPFIDGLRIGQEWRFRLAANPVRSVKGKADRGVVKPHVSVAHQTEWLLDRAERMGVEFLAPEGAEAGELITVSSRSSLEFDRFDRVREQRGRVNLRRVQFDGMLRVTDRDALSETLVKGIGRGKAYGMGLLTLTKAQSQ